MTRQSVALLFACTIAGYPLISAIPQLAGIDSRAVSVPYRAIVLALALLVFYLSVATGRLYRGAAWLPVICFWTLYVIRIAVDSVFFPIDLRITGATYIIFAFGTCFIPMAALFALHDDDTMRLAAKYAFYFCAAATLSAIYVNYRQLSLGTSDAYSSGRVSTETLNAVSLGHLGISLALLSLYFFRDQRLLGRIALAALTVIGLFTAAVSGSRGPILAFALSILFVLAVWARRQPPHRVLLGVIGALVAAYILILGAYVIEDAFGFRIVTRFATILNITADQSGRVHFDQLASAVEQFIQHPIFGSALHETRSRDYPHNVVVESFMTTGVVGGFMFCAFLIWATVAAARLSRDRAAAWIALLVVQQIVAALTSGALYLSAGMWVLGAAAIAVDAGRRAPAHSDVAQLPRPGWREAPLT